MVEGTPLQQENCFAVGSVGSYSFSEDEDDSPPHLLVPEASVATASMGTMACLGDSNKASLGGRHSRIEQMFSDVRENIGLVRAESASLVVITKNTHTAVGNSMDDFLHAIAIADQKKDLAFAAYERRVMAMAEIHTKTIGDMQAKL